MIIEKDVLKSGLNKIIYVWYEIQIIIRYMVKGPILVEG